MARKDDVFVQAVLDACAEAGIREGVQGFAANMSRSLAAMEKSGKLSVFQVAMALSWRVGLCSGPRSSGDRLLN
jgi:hypothetical protein